MSNYRKNTQINKEIVVTHPTEKHTQKYKLTMSLEYIAYIPIQSPRPSYNNIVGVGINSGIFWMVTYRAQLWAKRSQIQNSRKGWNGY